MISANYLKIQQTFLMEKIGTLTAKVRKAFATSEQMSSGKIWAQFTGINNKIFAFFEQLNAINKYWTFYLSTYFACHISIEVYLIYGLIFDQTSFDWFKRCYFIYFAIEFITLLFAITYVCSALVRHNMSIYKTNVTFCYAFSKRYRLNPFILLKVICFLNAFTNFFV